MTIDTHIRRLADARTGLHPNSTSTIAAGADYVGMRGEFAFGELIGLHPDTSARPGGDGGIDFVVPILTSVDVKTRRERADGKKCNLLVEQGKVNADIYVQAVLSVDEADCRCIGWIRARDLLRYRARDFGHGVACHAVPEGDLLAMELLTKRVHRWLNSVK